MPSHHVPVLQRETEAYLEPRRGGLFVDCTVGLGGHARGLLAAGPEVRLLGLDRDPRALELARRRLDPFGERVLLVEGDFRHLADHHRRLQLGPVRGLLADLGVSSLQLESAERGFSFRLEGPLDMRMGEEGVTAAEILERYPEQELAKVFSEYGEERQARRIARRVVEARARRPLRTTRELRELIHRTTGGRGGSRIDPATRVFQALRIAVNRELSGLRELLDQAVELLEPEEGKIVIISYHSLEDRIVKHAFRDLARGEVDPVTGRSRSETRVLEILTRKPVRPSPEEVERNPRSRSARLRAARRL